MPEMLRNLFSITTRSVEPFLSFGGGTFFQRAASFDPYCGGTGFSIILADAFCRTNKVETALKIIERNTLAFLKLRTLLPKKMARYSLKPRTISPDLKWECLRDSILIFEEKGIRSFLAFGSLLGFVRERRFIPHDLDIDLGLMTKETNVETVRDLLIENGFKITGYLGPKWPCRIKARHQNGISLDLVFFHEQDNSLMTYIKFLNHVIIRKRRSFDLEKSEFLGLKIWIPKDPELFLTENYGDWKNEHQFYHPILHSQLTDFSLPVIRYCLARAFYRSLALNDFGRIRLWLALANQYYPENIFWNEVKSLVEKRMPN